MQKEKQENPATIKMTLTLLCTEGLLLFLDKVDPTLGEVFWIIILMMSWVGAITILTMTVEKINAIEYQIAKTTIAKVLMLCNLFSSFILGVFILQNIWTIKIKK